MLKHAESGDTNEFLDLRDENCPFTFIKTKLKLEEMKKGEELKVIFSDEATARDVAKSLSSEGHEILDLKSFESGWILKIRCKH